MKPTDEQAAIYERAARLQQGDVLNVIAFAGAGKTTTLKGIAGVRRDRGVYLAFNRANADEAKKKLAMTKCTASSFHGLAYGALRELIGSPARLDARSVLESGVMGQFRLPRVEGWHDYRVASAVMRAMAAFANSADESFDVQHGREALVSSVGDPDFIRDREKRDEARDVIESLSDPVARIAEAYWIKESEAGNFSYDMQLKALDLNDTLRSKAFAIFRYLMADEAQDLNPVMRSIIQKTGLPVIAVGDPYQQIYSWRGAENALEQLGGENYFLTQSFRFGEEIAEVARHILACRPDGGPRQKLIGAGSGSIKDHQGPKIALVCRSNAGVIHEALRLMKVGTNVQVDNIEAILTDVRSAQALHDGNMDKVASADLKSFTSWEELCIEAEEGDSSLTRLKNIVEKKQTEQIEKLARRQAEGRDQAQVTVVTGHRSKGMEWPAVKLGGDWKDVNGLAGRWLAAQKKSEKHKTLAMEEYNTLYVAMTRPIMRLQGHQALLFPKSQEEKEMEMRAKLQAEIDASQDPASDPRDRPVMDHGAAPSFG